METGASRTDLGTIKIHKNVIASIASLAASEVEGVKQIGGDLKSGIAEFIGKQYLPSITVEISKNEEVRIQIPLVVKYGYNIPDVADKVQNIVRKRLEKMTNLSVKDIDVNIRGIERG